MLKKSSTVGKFESFHRGHQKLIKEAKKGNFNCDIISIWKQDKNTLFTLEEKKYLSKIFNVNLISIPFKIIRNLTPNQFFKLLSVHGYQKLTVGEDWHFGKHKSGNIITARKLGKLFNIKVITVKPEKTDGKKISTSWIKRLLKDGNLEKAKELLGFNYFTIGKPVKGLGIGRKIGFPTINIFPEKKLFIPYGVYKVTAILNATPLKGIANFGLKPTVSESHEETLEIYILDEKINKVPKKIKIDFLNFIRPEKRFESIEELKNQIKLDIDKIKAEETVERNSF